MLRPIDMSDLRELIKSLSPRQIEILRLVSEHYSSKEIARSLNLSPYTVDNHIASAIQRLGVTNRREAAAAYARFKGGHFASPSAADNTIEGDFSPGEESPGLTSAMDSSDDRTLSPGRDGGGSGKVILGGWWKRSVPPRRYGMGHVLFRCLLDAIFILVFFSIMASAAYGVHLVVKELESHGIDPIVLFILTMVSYALAGLDAIGVVIATGLLTFRFVRAIWRTDD